MDFFVGLLIGALLLYFAINYSVLKAFSVCFVAAFIISWMMRLLFHVSISANGGSNVVRQRNIKRFEILAGSVLMIVLSIIFTIIVITTRKPEFFFGLESDIGFKCMIIGVGLITIQTIVLYQKFSLLRKIIVIILYLCIPIAIATALRNPW